MKSRAAHAGIRSIASMPWAGHWRRSRRITSRTRFRTPAYEYQQAVERGEAIVVGVNRFKQEESEAPRISGSNPQLEQQQIAGLRSCARHGARGAVEAQTARARTGRALSRQSECAILACSEASATVGEISDRLRAVFGEIANVMTRADRLVSPSARRLQRQEQSRVRHFRTVHACPNQDELFNGRADSEIFGEPRSAPDSIDAG